MENVIRLLIMNAGSTSTKVAIYEGEAEKVRETINHPPEQIRQFDDIWDQYEFRKAAILQWVKEKGHELSHFSAIVSRGGCMAPAPAGIYLLNDTMLADMKSRKFGTHATNVGCLICYMLAGDFGLPAITVDPPTSDELSELAAYSGIPQIRRKGRFHALNQKAIARRLCKDLQKNYAEVNLIIVHLGGGISVGAHSSGVVVDVNNALDGDGPFSPERSGSLPAGDLVELCFSGRYTKPELLGLINGRGGLAAYLGTTSGLEIELRIQQGDETAREVIEAMAYQVCKEIGSMAAVLGGKIEAIGLTGGLANWARLVNLIKERVSFLAPIYLYPGEDEMVSLAAGALRYMRGEEQDKEYAAKGETEVPV